MISLDTPGRTPIMDKHHPWYPWINLYELLSWINTNLDIPGYTSTNSYLGSLSHKKFGSWIEWKKLGMQSFADYSKICEKAKILENSKVYTIRLLQGCMNYKIWVCDTDSIILLRKNQFNLFSLIGDLFGLNAKNLLLRWKLKVRFDSESKQEKSYLMVKKKYILCFD